jgi:hypothetical protein
MLFSPISGENAIPQEFSERISFGVRRRNNTASSYRVEVWQRSDDVVSESAGTIESKPADRAHQAHDGKTAKENEESADCAPCPSCRAGSAASGGEGAEQGEQTGGSSDYQAMVEVIDQLKPVSRIGIEGAATGGIGCDHRGIEPGADQQKDEGDQGGAARDDHQHPPDSRPVTAPIG